MNVTAVIPNYNGAARLAKLLPQLQGSCATVIVVDNGSSDASVAVSRGCGATVIGFDRNMGFARAVNAGILAAPRNTEWVAILNNDVTLRQDFFRLLTAGAGDSWFAAPKVLCASDPAFIDGTFDLPTRAGTAYRAGAGAAADSPAFRESREILCAPMTASIFRRRLFDKIGLLDETFGSYLEDVDFGIRCALEGCRGRYAPDAVALHEGSATLGGSWSPGSTRWISRNQVLLSKKYSDSPWPAAWGQLLWGLLAIRHGVFGSWLRGKLEGLKTPVSRQCHQNWRRLVLDCERQIEALQRQNGWDWYWRQYFRWLPAGGNGSQERGA